MAELDKKIQKAQTDLVQAVLEAQEKRNAERVDMLVTNAIKQLKMSRFKPDLTTCLSLAYLAKIQSRLFHHSATIKDTLKSLLRRDQGPANIKGKNDIVLPVLAANLLLATCDAPETRTLILHKIEQWLAASQKVSDLVQHLLATLCIKCQADKQTISTLVDMRQHWIQYLDDNYSFYGPVPVDLSASIRRLLKSETNCESLLGYLKFLIKHDTDTDGLSLELSKFVIERPISLKNMLQEETHGMELNKMMLKTYNKLFESLRGTQQQQQLFINTDTTVVDVKEQKKIATEESKAEVSMNVDEQKVNLVTDSKPLTSGIKVKIEPDSLKSELKSEDKYSTTNGSIKNAPPPNSQDDNSNSNGNGEMIFYKILYIKMSNCSHTIALSRPTIEAVLTLLSLVDETNDEWPFDEHTAIYEDFALKTPYNVPDQLRQKLIHSNNNLLINFGLSNASTNQLISLLQTFGLSTNTLGKILKRLESIKDAENIKSEIKDVSFFNQMVEFYKELGVPGATSFHQRLEQSTVSGGS